MATSQHVSVDKKRVSYWKFCACCGTGLAMVDAKKRARRSLLDLQDMAKRYAKIIQGE